MDKLDLSAGTLARLKLLTEHYGSIEAVIDQGVELLTQLELDTSRGLTSRAGGSLNTSIKQKDPEVPLLRWS